MSSSIKSPEDVLTRARDAFKTGITKNATFRLHQLKALLRLYEENQSALLNALAKDLRKSKQEAMVCEIEYLKNDARGAIYELSSWLKPDKPAKNISNLMDQVLIHKDPLGVVLIIGAWNYPIQLSLAPLTGAIAAGNCAIVKPSELAPASSKLIAELLPKYLDTDCYHVIEGGVAETTQILALKFDHIFFTGSSQVGKIVYEAAAKYMTPVTLELGGKSPVYLDDSVDLEVAVPRILWGKLMNAGQTCIAPDFVLAPKKLHKRFVQVAQEVLSKWYGDKIKQSPDYGRIINQRHFDRIVSLLTGNPGVTADVGGDYDRDDLYIAPTIITNISPSHPLLQEEIFGPILPIVTVESAHEAVDFINAREKPLALYIFSNKKDDVDVLIRSTSSGGVCVNDTVMHFSCDNAPFGGVGNSGIGNYHGKYSFDTFTHKKTTLVRDTGKLGEKLQQARYPPFNDSKLGFITTMTKKRPSIPLVYVCHLVTFGLGVLVTLGIKCASSYLQAKQEHHL